METIKFIAYYRVSTQKQGASGLGLDSQKDIIHTYTNRIPDSEIAGEYTEIETGTAKRERTEIFKALAQCKAIGATLIVAKLDRLARDTKFVLSVMDSGADVVFCDFPQCNRLMITIIAAIAEYEASLISSRTKAALQEKKKTHKLGNPDIKVVQLAGTRAAASARSAAKSENKKAFHLIRQLRENGNSTYQEIADALNSSSHKSSTGKEFTPGSVSNIYTRYKQTA